VPAQVLSWCDLFDLIINTHSTGGRGGGQNKDIIQIRTRLCVQGVSKEDRHQQN